MKNEVIAVATSAGSSCHHVEFPNKTPGHDKHSRLRALIEQAQLTEPRSRHPMRRAFNIVWDAFDHFNADDGWAIASHIALSLLMAMFPFFILLTSLAGFLDPTARIADEIAELLLTAWPVEVAGPIVREIHNVLTKTHTGVVTLGVVLALFFASSGVESLRIGLNRAYGTPETRHWIVLRLESIAYVLVATLSSMALGFLIVLGPLLFRTALFYMPWLAPLEGTFTLLRICVATVVLIVALIVIHKWLPAGHRRFVEIVPGVIATLLLWLAAGIAFGRYLAQFSWTYVSTYAGLATAMIALVYLYLTALIFIYGAELNAAVFRPGVAHPPREPTDVLIRPDRE
jgi:membrane protein